MICGSEGILGIITEATMRLQHRPKWRATASVIFNNFLQGAEAVRLISQSGLFPANCRLLDEQEVLSNQVADKPCAVLVLGFESADHEVKHSMQRALEIACDNGGKLQGEASYSAGAEDKKQGAAQSWRNAFIRMPYWRNRLTAFGIVADTFETAITWDRFPDFYRTVKREMEKAIAEVSGYPCSFSCRFTHIYPDGPAPYFTFYMVGDTQGDLHKAIDKWKVIKQQSAGKIGSLLELLQGKLSDQVMQIVTDRKEGLFPQPKEISFKCDCPDWAGMCQHIAAVMYGIGARLDASPELLFTLRGVDHQELIAVDAEAALSTATKSGKAKRIAASDLSDVFGIDLDSGDETETSAAVAPATKKRSRSSAKLVPAKKPAAKKVAKKVAKKKSAKRKTSSPTKAVGSVKGESKPRTVKKKKK